MEFEGTVVQVLTPAKGVSARGEWTKQEVVFEQAGEFGRKVCVSFWGDKAADAAALVTGDKVRVSANVESREYNGRWYTEVRAWKMDRTSGGAAAGAPHGAATGAPYGAAEYDWGASQSVSSQGSGSQGHGAASGMGAQGMSSGMAPQPPLGSEPAETSTSKEEFDDLPF